MRRLHTLVAFACALVIGTAEVQGVPFEPAFTFQSQLDMNGSPLNGTVDCRFELFADESGGVSIAAPVVVSNLAVTDGLLNATLNFGVDVFDGDARWLSVSLRSPHDPTDLQPFTALAPRQSLTPIPYAMQSRGIFVDENEKVSIGVAPKPLPTSKMRVRAAETDLVALLAESPATVGDAVGIKGTTASSLGRGVEGIGPSEGVRGHAEAASGDAIGVRGVSDSVDGVGVVGEAASEGVRGVAGAMTGTARGVCGASASADGEGVFGHATAKSGAATGVKGKSDSPDGKGVVGEAIGGGTGVQGMGEAEGVRGEATTGTGVCGVSSSATGQGVLGHASAGAGSTVGVKGMSDSSTGTGVMGEAATEGVRGTSTATSGTARGVCGISASGSGEGVVGHATAVVGTPIGVRGVTDSGGGRGVSGESPNGGFGVWGETAGTGAGVVGVTNSSGFGVQGTASASAGVTTGVYGNAVSPDGTGVTGVGGKNGVAGLGSNGTASSVGVRGQSLGQTNDSAGVRALGNGVSGVPGEPWAAALEISEGAINVSGGIRPAGKVTLGGTWTAITDCGGDTIGYTQDVQLTNDLITGDCMIWVTVELDTADIPGRAFSAHVFDQDPGSATIRVTAFGKTAGPGCSAPSAGITRQVSYLIINPLP